MLRAVWNGAALAEELRTIRLEGNHYFPPGPLNRRCFTATRTWWVCQTTPAYAGRPRGLAVIWCERS